MNNFNIYFNIVFSKLFLCLFMLSGMVSAQSVTINPQANNSGIINVQSTNKGVLVPNMTTAQRIAIALPEKGLLVFDTTSGSFWFHNGTSWTELGNSGTSYWTPSGTQLSSTGFTNFNFSGGTAITALSGTFPDGADGTMMVYSPPSGLAGNYLNLDASNIQARRYNFFTGKSENSLKLNPFGGNVGIGTTTPSTTLDVNGHTMSGTYLATSARNSHIQGAYLEWNKDGAGGKTYLLNQRGTGLGGFIFGEIDNTNNITERIKIDNSGALQLNGAIAYKSVSITLTSGVSYENLSTFNTSYMILNVLQNTIGINLANGNYVGQQLIIQVKTSLVAGLVYPLTIIDNSALTNINTSGQLNMANNSILTLIWDGTDWQQIAFSQNGN